MNSVSTIEVHVPTRIFARQVARELSREEVAKVSGGRRPEYTWCEWPCGPSAWCADADDC